MSSLKKRNVNNFKINSNGLDAFGMSYSKVDLLLKAVMTKQHSSVLKLLNSIKSNKVSLQQFVEELKQDTSLIIWKTAIVNQDVKTIKMLLDTVSEYSFLYQNSSVLELAISSNNNNIVKMLFRDYLKSNNDPSGQLKAKAIILALKEEKFDAAKALLEIGKDINNCKHEGDVVKEAIITLVKELNKKDFISNVKYGESYSIFKVTKEDEKELEALKFISLLLSKGASIFTKNEKGYSLADSLYKQEEIMKNLANNFHIHNIKEYENEGTQNYFLKLIFNIQNHFSQPYEMNPHLISYNTPELTEKTISPYINLHLVNNVIKSVLPIQQKIAYQCYKLKYQVHQNDIPRGYGGHVDFSVETVKDYWEKAKTIVKALMSDFMPQSTNFQDVKDYIENISNIKSDVELKCSEIFLTGAVEESITPN